MSSVQLLDKTRKIGKLLYNNNKSKVAFNDVCKVMKDVTGSNALVVSKKGKILGMSISQNVPVIKELLGEKVGVLIDKDLNERFLGILSTKENVSLSTLGFEEQDYSAFRGVVTPIVIGGERLGTMFTYRNDAEYEIDDIILCEHAMSVIGLEMLRSVSEEQAEENRKASAAHAAINTLSGSEAEAIVHVFDELGGMEGVVIASKIADRVGITRSVIVNALRKLESAEVIESKSSGMKGTYIKIHNDMIFDEIEKLKKA